MAREATSPAALLGTHTDQVLHEILGLDGAAVGRLHDAGVVAGPEHDPTGFSDVERSNSVNSESRRNPRCI
jgi:2-methylfumaryl-CoA isomerase